jgi:hypothetical protein
MTDPKASKPSKIRKGIPIDEAMRTEHGEPVVRPKPNVDEEHDPADSSDQGPHVDRVGMPQPDTDSR